MEVSLVLSPACMAPCMTDFEWCHDLLWERQYGEKEHPWTQLENPARTVTAETSALSHIQQVSGVQIAENMFREVFLEDLCFLCSFWCVCQCPLAGPWEAARQPFGLTLPVFAVIRTKQKGSRKVRKVRASAGEDLAAGLSSSPLLY